MIRYFWTRLNRDLQENGFKILLATAVAFVCVAGVVAISSAVHSKLPPADQSKAAIEAWAMKNGLIDHNMSDK